MTHLHVSTQSTGGSAPAGGAPLAGIPASALPRPRVVTTGRKKPQNKQEISRATKARRPEFAGIDPDTGEPVELLHNGRRSTMIRHLRPHEVANLSVAIVDALTFTLVPPDDQSYDWVLDQMESFLDFGTVEHRRGGFAGFKHSADLVDGVKVGRVAWGGKNQRGRVYFGLMGQGCARINNLTGLAEWLEQHDAKITRVDLAHDDREGKRINIAWGVEQYANGGFNAGGRNPRHSTLGDWLDGDASVHGRTLGIGNRKSGKYLRLYEKGKQLGDPKSRWTRVEVEWRHQDRHIPYDVLMRPGQYLAGAYPCLAFLNEEQSIIKTIAKAAEISFDAAIKNTKQQAGKLVNLCLQVFGGDYVEVVKQLIRPGVPKRIDPYSYHLKDDFSRLDPALRAGFA